ncbi:unnamed protein product [Withania somnifera]
MLWFKNLIKISTTILNQSSSSKSITPLASSSLGQFKGGTNHHVAGLEPTKSDQKPRVVLLGFGWAGCRLMKNHMVLTPLLAYSCVGTLEFRSVAEPIGRIQPAISTEPSSFFFLANCNGIDFDNHKVQCQTVMEGVETMEPWNFNVSYDKLVIAYGAEALTFGIKGVNEHATFLREVYHAQEIRRKLLLNLMLSDVPGVSEEEKCRLLHCVVVGGGPTGANEILSSFDDRLRIYATKQLTKKIILSDGTDVPYGLFVWSTGVGPSPFVNSLDIPKAKGIGIDEWLCVPWVQDVYSIVFLKVQVAERQGKYFSSLLNKVGKEGGGHANSAQNMNLGDPFIYKHLGSMATIGKYKALVDLREKQAKGASLAGFTSFFVWRSAYLTLVEEQVLCFS